MSIQDKSLSQITQQAIEVLSNKINIANTVRFLNQFSTGYGNYTKERENLFKDLTLGEIQQADEEYLTTALERTFERSGR